MTTDEVVAGNTIYEMDGSITWSDDYTDAAPAMISTSMDVLTLSALGLARSR